MIDYQKYSRELALDLINKRLTTPLRLNDVEIEKVTYLEEGVYNTRATLVAKTNGAFSGQTTVEYDRLNIGTFFHGTPIEVEASNQKMISDYLDYLKNHYGLYLTAPDVVDGKINDENLTPPYQFILEIKKWNPAWYGKLPVTVVSSKPALKSLLSHTETPKETLPEMDGRPHFYGADFTVISGQLEGYQEGQYLKDNLVNYLNQVSPHHWVFEPEMKAFPFNLANSQVIYNGLVEDTALSARRDISHVMVVKLNEEYCTKMEGYLLLHYNKSTKIDW